MLFHCIIALQLLLPSLALNATNADSAQSDDAPVRFRDVISFVVVAGIFCLCLWFVFRRCCNIKTVFDKPQSLRYGGIIAKGMPM